MKAPLTSDVVAGIKLGCYDRMHLLAIQAATDAAVGPFADAVAPAQTYPTACPTCRGTGGGQYNDCPTCDGNGEI